jgi:transposase-like protein
MGHSEEVGAERRVRRWRSVAEKRQIVKQTLEPGASVALIARAHGLNANQVFKWRRAFERGELVDSAASSTASCSARPSLRLRRSTYCRTVRSAGVQPEPRRESDRRSAAPYDVASAEPSGPTPESHRSTSLSRPSSLPDAPSSCAAHERRSSLPHAPSADARPTSAPHRSPNLPQTRTPGESARIAPPWLSSPTRPPFLSAAEKRGRVRSAQGWAKTARVSQIRMPKSTVHPEVTGLVPQMDIGSGNRCWVTYMPCDGRLRASTKY